MIELQDDAHNEELSSADRRGPKRMTRKNDQKE